MHKKQYKEFLIKKILYFTMNDRLTITCKILLFVVIVYMAFQIGRLFSVRPVKYVHMPMVVNVETSHNIMPSSTIETQTMPSPTIPVMNFKMPGKETIQPSESPVSRKNTPERVTYRVKVTHYCACNQCCGNWSKYGRTASGTIPKEGCTIAHGWLPFGTVVEINGDQYTVEDRGVRGNRVDIFINDHDEALKLGAYWTDMKVIRMGG